MVFVGAAPGPEANGYAHSIRPGHCLRRAGTIYIWKKGLPAAQARLRSTSNIAGRGFCISTDSRAVVTRIAQKIRPSREHPFKECMRWKRCFPNTLPRRLYLQGPDLTLDEKVVAGLLPHHQQTFDGVLRVLPARYVSAEANPEGV